MASSLRTSACHRNKLPIAGTVCAVLCAVISASAHGDDAGILGNWGGLRNALAERGIGLEASYTNEFAGNVRGGARTTAADAEQFYLGARLDLRRLLEVPGARLVFSITDRNGESLSIKAGLRTLLEVQEIYGEGNYTRLNQVYWDQELFGKKLVLKLGRLTGSSDFMPFSCYFLNATFCGTLPGHNVAANWVPFPGSTWAGLARLNWKSGAYMQAGVYEVNPDLQLHKSRLVLGQPFDGKTREVVEFGWVPESAGPEGGYRVGAWYDNFGGYDLFLNTSGEPQPTDGSAPLWRHHQHGFYAMAQQRVWTQGTSGSRGISVFVNFVQADPHIAKVAQITEVGLFWRGLLSGRPQDDLGFAAARTHVNSLVARAVALYNSQVAQSLGLPPEPIPANEYPMEIYYSLNVTPAVTVVPDIQFIHDPGGVNQDADVLLFGGRLVVRF